MHKAGYLHLDLKPDNIVLSSNDMRNQLSSIVCLIDFGISKPYLDENFEHIPYRENVPFVGNFLFASKNAFF